MSSPEYNQDELNAQFKFPEQDGVPPPPKVETTEVPPPPMPPPPMPKKTPSRVRGTINMVKNKTGEAFEAVKSSDTTQQFLVHARNAIDTIGDKAASLSRDALEKSREAKAKIIA